MVIQLGDYEKAIMDYAMREDRLGEEFFAGRMKILRDSVEERLQQIERREQVHASLLEEISRQRSEREDRARMFTYKEAPMKTLLLRQADALAAEARMERARFHRDVAGLTREAREKLEEYESMAQLFSALAVRRDRSGAGPVSCGDEA